MASIFTGFAQSLLQIGLRLALIGIFASIYHPVGIAMVIEGGGKVGWRLGVNGLRANIGVAAAPLVKVLILVQFDWRMAFIIPGSISILIDLGFIGYVRSFEFRAPEAARQGKELIGFAAGCQHAFVYPALVTASGGFIF